MSTISTRLREDRKRLNLTQEEAALLAGVTRRPYLDWEHGNTYPNALHLAGLAKAGFDVRYIITGVQAGDVINHNHKCMYV